MGGFIYTMVHRPATSITGPFILNTLHLNSRRDWIAESRTEPPRGIPGESPRTPSSTSVKEPYSIISVCVHTFRACMKTLLFEACVRSLERGILDFCPMNKLFRVQLGVYPANDYIIIL